MCIVSNLGLERMIRTMIVDNPVEIQTEHTISNRSIKGYRQIKLLHCRSTELQIYIRIRLILQHKSALTLTNILTDNLFYCCTLRLISANSMPFFYYTHFIYTACSITVSNTTCIVIHIMPYYYRLSVCYTVPRTFLYSLDCLK